MNNLRIPVDIIGQFCTHAENEYPHECCGFLIGKFDDDGGVITEYRQGNNTKQSQRERRFLIDPADYQNTEDDADSNNLSIVGILHSHPDHPDIPSEFDKEHAFPGFSYVIVSVKKGKTAGYRSWQLKIDRSQFREELITQI